MSITTVIEDQINEELHKNGDGIVTAYLGNGRWVVIDTEDQSVCLVTVEDAEIIPKGKQYVDLLTDGCGEVHKRIEMP